MALNPLPSCVACWYILVRRYVQAVTVTSRDTRLCLLALNVATGIAVAAHLLRESGPAAQAVLHIPALFIMKGMDQRKEKPWGDVRANLSLSLLLTAWMSLAVLGVPALAGVRVPAGYGAALPFLTILRILVRPRPDRHGPVMRAVVRLLWDPPCLAAAHLGPYLGGRLFHDGAGRLASDVDGRLCVGGMPLAGDVPELRRRHGVCAVVNMCGEYAGPVDAYARAGIVQCRLPTLDTTCPAAGDLERGVAFIRSALEDNPGRRVYVHCKGGRGRACSMAVYWLMSEEGLSLDEAFTKVKAKRKVAESVILRYSTLKAFQVNVSKK